MDCENTGAPRGAVLEIIRSLSTLSYQRDQPRRDKRRCQKLGEQRDLSRDVTYPELNRDQAECLQTIYSLKLLNTVSLNR